MIVEAHTDLRAELDACRELLTAETEKADVGELASPVTHEVNNLLNNLGLTLALLEFEFPGHSGSLQRLRRQADSVTQLIREFQEFRGRPAPSERPIDPVPVLRSMMEDPEGQSRGCCCRGNLEVVGDIPAVRGNRRDVGRLLRFLIQNAAEAADHANSELRVQIKHEADCVLVRLELPGVKGSQEVATRVMEPGGEPLPGMSRLQFHACRTLARRLGGVVQVLSAAGELQMLLKLPVY